MFTELRGYRHRAYIWDRQWIPILNRYSNCAAQWRGVCTGGDMCVCVLGNHSPVAAVVFVRPQIGRASCRERV